MSPPRILVAGIGNIFLGDDAFGSEVAQKLLRRHCPEGVRIVDFGIRGLDLVYALLNGYESVILIDAVQRGGALGTLYVLEPELDFAGTAPPLIEAHSMDPAKVLRTAAAMGARPSQVYLVACEAAVADFDCVDAPIEMSAGAVRLAVDEAVTLVESLMTKLFASRSPSAQSICQEAQIWSH